MDHPNDPIDVAVIGGGLAGLTAATFAARTGAKVVLLDARSDLGGRARTQVDDGYRFNEGPHALYKAGAGTAALRELGIAPRGGLPSLRARYSLDGELHRVTPARATGQIAGLLRRLSSDLADPAWVDEPATAWIEHRVSDPIARKVAAGLVRVSSYSGDLDTFSADGAITQLHAAIRGVIYLDDGWMQLVEALEATATAAGVTIRRGAREVSLVPDGDHWTVSAADGPAVTSAAVLVAAGGPSVADRLTGERSELLGAAAAAALPVHAACLDLGLGRLPRPSHRFVLGLDVPTYASVHTPSARLADQGDVLHVMRYEPGPDVTVADLESIADEIQPGWQAHEEARQVGRQRVVAFDRPQPGRGMKGRMSSTVDDLPCVFVAGDWVGPHDLLGGASLSSGRIAGLAAAAQSAGRRTPALATRP